MATPRYYAHIYDSAFSHHIIVMTLSCQRRKTNETPVYTNTDPTSKLDETVSIEGLTHSAPAAV